jgi:hypothetical protein
MLYWLQVDIIVAIAVMLPFFAIYLALLVLKVKYLAAIRCVHVAKAYFLRLKAASRNLMGDTIKVAIRPSRGN